MYESFLSDLDELRKQTARFRRVALHCHSPDSHDWGKGGDASLNVRSQFQDTAGLEIFAAVLRSQLDLVAITDHMRCTFAGNISRHIGKNDAFMILPGMEVNFRLDPPLEFARIHMLAILPEHSGPEAFAKLLSGQNHIPDDADRNGQEELRNILLDEWVKRIHTEGGICIAAHVDNNQGVRHYFRQSASDVLQLICEGNDTVTERENEIPENFKEFLYRSEVDALEVQRATDAQHYRWLSRIDGQIRSIPTLLTFDAHNLESFARPNRVTHLKMTSLGMKGLKQALMFPDTRIRYPDNLPESPCPKILGVQIAGDDSSFFENTTVAFAENLNCVIGVRGSGKSTLVEALRYVFGYNETLTELDTPLSESIRSLQRANLAGSVIRIAYQTRTNDVRILEATYDPKSDYVTKVFTSDGQVINVDRVERTGEYPLRLYGWSEMENLGREPARQRDLLDRLIPELLPVSAERSELQNQLRANRGEIEKHLHSVLSAFASNDGEITRYAEFKGDFDKLNTPAVRETFASLDLANHKRRILVLLRENAFSVTESLKELGAVNLRGSIDEVLSSGIQGLGDWWNGDELQVLNLSAVETDVQGLLNQAVLRLESLIGQIDGRIETLDSEIQVLQSGLRESFSDDASLQRIYDLRTNAEARLRRVTELRSTYQRAWDQLTAAINERKSIGTRLAAVQDRLAGIRTRHNGRIESRLNGFLPESMLVSIDFTAAGDKAIFGDFLQGMYGARSHQVKRIRRVAEANATPVSFANMLLEGDCSPLTELDPDFTDDDAQLASTRFLPFEHNDSADVPTLSQEGKPLRTILDLFEIAWDDKEVILLDGGPVDKKSPGQRSSAMLPLIALAQDTPLIIDQPEDNIDKRLIGSVLMKVLAVLKENRQIIVCTHDPNILVGGDAEQVVVLEAQSDSKGSVLHHGSIDNDEIVDTVVNILEGGAEAFKTRQKRYEGHVSSTTL